MPKIFTTTTKGSFRDALSKMKRGILPDKIQSNSLAMWVMNFDELTRERDERRYRSNYPEKEFIARWALETALGIAIQKQLPFYFSSLFYIGRQWYVSERTIASIQTASNPQNVIASVELTKKKISARHTPAAQALSEAPDESLTELFRSILEGGLEYHQAQLQQAHIWWDEWQEEVRPLKKAVDSYRESSPGRIRDNAWAVASEVIIGSYQVSALRSSMTTAGIKFKGDAAQVSSTGYPPALDPMLPMLIAALSSGPYRDRTDFDYERLFHYWLDILHYAPEVQIALEHLNRKYGSKNPFDPYRPLLKAASQELRALIQEHKLPNHNPSPWLHAWSNSLERDPWWWTSLQYHPLENPEVIQSFLRSADSAIKRQLGDGIRPGETWQGFIQRLFEYGWVSRIARAIANANKKSQSETTSWSFQSFVELIARVIKGLQGLGYELTFIKEERCLVVWNKVHGEGWIGDEGW